MGEELYSERLARIHWTSPGEEKQAFAYLTLHQDQDYSAVDCLSFVVMENLELREALTIDGHFKHRFVALPGPRPK